jgi:N utilization substance protein B
MLERRRARHQALHILYQKEITGRPASEILAEGTWDVRPLDVEDCEDSFSIGEPPEFMFSILEGVDAHSADIDATIERLSQHWVLSRMPLVDRNILRIAVYELLYEPEIPSSVTINEAVEMAKVYAGEDSSKFVNGILGKLADETGESGALRERDAPDAPGALDFAEEFAGTPLDTDLTAIETPDGDEA